MERIADCYAIKSLKIYAQANVPRFFMDNDNLQCVQASQRSDDALCEPGIQTLANFSLKLNGDRTVWQVYWHIHSYGDCVLEAVTETKILIVQ